MKDLEKVITKIKNLIELAQDKDDQEGIQSMLLARKLMLKHGIEQSQLDIKQSEVIEGMATMSKNVSWWQKILATVVQDNFRVKVYIDRSYKNSSIVFMGMTDDVEIAKAIYEQLTTMIDHYSNVFINRHYATTMENRNRSRTTLLKKSYISGFINGLKKALKEQTSELMEQYEMVLVTPREVVDAYNNLSLRSSKVSSPHRVDSNSYDKGYARGKEFKPVSGNIE